MQPIKSTSRLKRSYLYAPLIGMNIYVISGMLISFFGPLQYKYYEKDSVFLFISAFLAVFNIFYAIGTKVSVRQSHSWSPSRRRSLLVLIFQISLTFSVIFMTYEFFYGFLIKGLSFNISNSGASYLEGYAGHERNSGNYSLNFLVLSIMSLPIFIVQIWSLLYFEILPRRARILAIYVFAMTILIYTIGGGKQKQLGDIMVFISVVFFIKRAFLGKINFRALAKIMGVVLLSLYLMLVILASRYSNIGIDLSVLNANLHPLIYYVDGNILERTLGEAGAFPIVMLSGYLGQGYYGLSLSLQQPFTWTSFGGASYSFSVILNQFFGTDFLVEKSYPYLVGASTGWAETKWHTAFSWLASDLTFPGTVLFLGYVGFCFARGWKEALLFKNPFSILLIALLSIGIFYISANNQLMHSPGGLWTLGWVIILYSAFSSKFNFRNHGGYP